MLVASASLIPSLCDFDTLPLASWLLELDGTVVAANQQARRFAGDHAGAKIWSIAPELEGRWLELVPAALNFGAYIAELEVGGRAVQLHATLREHEGIRYLFMLATDLSALRARIEDERQRAIGQRLESLGLVAGGIAHELNNQLVNVVAEAGNLREDESLSGEIKDALGRVESAAKRMARLTRQLLAYAGRGRFVTSVLDADVLLAETTAALQRRLPPSASFEIALGGGAVAVEADSGLLRQVIRELIENAGDALRGRQGRIAVASRTVVEADRQWWQLEITDDGIGIDAATRARIFDPFFSTKPNRHGLGLSAALGIARRLGGDICVDSTPGKGATFRVRLPIVAEAVPVRRRSTSEHPPLHALSGLKILVADDEPSVRATVQRLLHRRAAHPVLASDGGEAEQLLRSGQFDVVLLDVMMPKRTGYELVPIARETQPRAPVILMSGYSEQASNVEPPDAFLEKPFNGTTLEETIRGALTGLAMSGRAGSDAG
jgi:signal transduction histidine kinase/CheY-like chemotaxis protein